MYIYYTIYISWLRLIPTTVGLAPNRKPLGPSWPLLGGLLEGSKPPKSTPNRVTASDA